MITSLLLREQIIHLTRLFYRRRHFQEITLSLLYPSLPLEPNLYSFEIKIPRSSKKYYLPTSPETGMKKFLSLYQANCFTIGHSFRNLESSGPIHRPEFLMLEAYLTNKNYISLIPLLEHYILFIFREISKKNHNHSPNLLKYQAKSIDLTPPWPRLTLTQLFARYAHIDLPAYLASPDFKEDDYNQIFLNRIEPRLPRRRPIFILDYPAVNSPLVKPITNNSLLAERFELYLAGIEIANGNTENRNPKALKKSMLLEQNYRRRRRLPTHPIDHEFITASGLLPPSAGFGLGLDRLIMILADQPQLF